MLKMILSAVLFLILASAPAQAADRGRVSFVKGTVSLNGKPAVKGGTVNEGDNLTTEKNSYADVLMESGVRFRMYGNSKLEIPKASTANPFRLLYGSILSIVKKGRPYSVAGNTATAGVRGTTFFVESTPGRRTYVCICKGKLHLEADGHDKGDIASQNHKAVALDGTSNTEEPMLGHTDDEIAELTSR